MTHLQKLLRQRRLELGLTQREVGKALGYASQFVTNWERGASKPPARRLPKLAKTLKVPGSALVSAVLADEHDRLMQIFARKR